MEILKTLVVVLKLFQLKRVGKEETIVREGFFTKAAECKVVITRRDCYMRLVYCRKMALAPLYYLQNLLAIDVKAFETVLIDSTSAHSSFA